ncbi:hypothetical protein RUM44_007477 [Polyplax serrata]|uniref:Uncharacterized protein n=1 Tax=Polyplax serrata TaxID=468196 RepID=A0ABR1B0S1_POLSC
MTESFLTFVRKILNREIKITDPYYKQGEEEAEERNTTTKQIKHESQIEESRQKTQKNEKRCTTKCARIMKRSPHLSNVEPEVSDSPVATVLEA